MYSEKDLEIVGLIGVENFKKLNENGYKITKAKVDLDKVLPRDKIVLTVQLDEKDNFKIITITGGKPFEVFGHNLTREKAIVSMTSLLCGFQIPNRFENFDIPFPQIEPE